MRHSHYPPYVNKSNPTALRMKDYHFGMGVDNNKEHINTRFSEDFIPSDGHMSLAHAENRGRTNQEIDQYKKESSQIDQMWREYEDIKRENNPQEIIFSTRGSFHTSLQRRRAEEELWD